MRFLQHFPFINGRTAMTVMRVGVAMIFFLHALFRLINDTILQFGAFMEAKGITAGVTLVWLITLFELVGSVALAIGSGVRVWAAGFIVILLAGIVLIHWDLGWFVGEHGTGGCEYSVALILMLLLLAADDHES
ncbi:DoxX family protein [Nostoc ellipsosporum NOK]|jgi:putative oxidoreductase|nr:DoxX family protein [Nostoc ellipsosporum NOK]